MGAKGGYSEERIVEQPAIALFAELGWQTTSAMEEKFGAGGTLGRETSGEVVLAPRLRAALEKLNPKLPAEATCSGRPGARARASPWCSSRRRS